MRDSNDEVGIGEGVRNEGTDGHRFARGRGKVMGWEGS